MPLLQQFQRNIDASDRLVAMYRELRASRHLGARGVLNAQNQDLLWLPRSAVVASISALDTYVHAVVNDRLPGMFAAPAALPDSLCEQLAQLLPIKNATTFREAAALIHAGDSTAQLLRKLDEKYLRFQSFQAPEKISEAYKLIGHATIFNRAAELWPGPNRTADQVRRKLAGYVQRRNQIAHEGDLEPDGRQRAMQPDYAADCREFIGLLVARLHQAAYGA